MTKNSALRIIIHIGLHKTATRFFQKHIFLPMRTEGVLYNPPELMVLLHDLFRRPDRMDSRSNVILEFDRIRSSHNHDLLVISKPDIPGEMYDGYPQHRENIALLKSVAPDASILYIARRPSDWLQSAYRQSLVKGAGGPIETFLNFEDGRFLKKRALLSSGMRNLNALNLPVLGIYQASVDSFGSEDVLLVCFEHFKTNKVAVLESLRRFLGVAALSIDEPMKIKNRSFSALAIQIFCGGRATHIPTKLSMNEPTWLLKRFIYRPLRKIRANWIKHVFDNIFFKDWDLLERRGMRAELDAHYFDQYETLMAISALQHLSNPDSGEEQN